MKKIIILLFVFSVQLTVSSQGVKIGGSGEPDPTAMVEIDGSSGKGFLLPRLTNTTMNALNATNGMVVYNSTDASIYLRKNGGWQKIAEGNASGGGFTLPLVSSQNLPGTYLLDLSNTGTGAGTGAIKGFSESGNGGYFSSNTGNALVTGDGNVGIGTSTPAYPLTLDAAGNGFVHKGGGVEIGTNVSAIGGMLQTFTNHPLRFGAGSNVTKMILTTSGELGVGTSIPWAKMHAAWNNSALLQLENTNPLVAGMQSRQLFKIGAFYTGGIGTTGQDQLSARLSFYTGTGATTSSFGERMTILNNGNVGINNITPLARLDVTGKTILNQYFDNAAVEIKGSIKVSGAAPAGFTIQIPPLGSGIEGLPTSFYTIDNPACNGKPNAMLFVTAVGDISQAVSVRYEPVNGKWMIRPDQITLGYLLPDVKYNVLVIDK